MFHTEELYAVFRSPNIIRENKSTKLRGGRDTARMEEYRSTSKILRIVLVEKRTLRGPKRRREDNIRIDLKEMHVNTR